MINVTAKTEHIILAAKSVIATKAITKNKAPTANKIVKITLIILDTFSMFSPCYLIKL